MQLCTTGKESLSFSNPSDTITSSSSAESPRPASRGTASWVHQQEMECSGRGLSQQQDYWDTAEVKGSEVSRAKGGRSWGEGAQEALSRFKG